MVPASGTQLKWFPARWVRSKLHIGSVPKAQGRAHFGAQDRAHCAHCASSYHAQPAVTSVELAELSTRAPLRPGGCSHSVGRGTLGPSDCITRTRSPMAIELLGEPHRNPQTDVKGLSILARSLFRQMRQQGYSTEQIIGLSSELIQLVREDLQKGLAAE
jgi:hypothetical protein